MLSLGSGFSHEDETILKNALFRLSNLNNQLGSLVGATPGSSYEDEGQEFVHESKHKRTAHSKVVVDEKKSITPEKVSV